jgi:hypothetical protein
MMKGLKMKMIHVSFLTYKKLEKISPRVFKKEEEKDGKILISVKDAILDRLEKLKEQGETHEQTILRMIRGTQ